ncbi:MAG: N-acetylmuramoyl-L-alanine amidase, partial [Caulobacteraceae bacterium]
ALGRLTDPAAKVSVHWMIDEAGEVFRLVPEERRAWHAGVSFWKGERNLNGVSIGIELVNPGHEFGYRPFPEIQIDVLLDLIEEIRGRWIVPDARILAHSDVAPQRRADPGELFPWRRLAAAGHGLLSTEGPAPGPVLRKGDEGPAVLVLKSGLARLGYELSPSEKFDEATKGVVEAFQRHWAQEKVSGEADGLVRARLVDLIRRFEGP